MAQVSTVTDPRGAALLEAQQKADQLFRAIEAQGIIRPGTAETQINQDIYDLAETMFGISSYWHKRIVRAGRNTLAPYDENPPDLIVGDDDIIFLDFGPVFEAWEADFGRTYVVGSDPDKHRLVADLAQAFARGKNFYRQSPNLTAGELYDYIAALAADYGWQWGAKTAGHLIGHFPHETRPQDPDHLRIRHGNSISLREPDEKGRPRHWILEVHFVDRAREIGGFFEELLTVDADS